MNTYALQPLDESRDQAPDPMVISAWLDGQANAEQSAQVEAWMAADPEALDQMLQLQVLASQPVSVNVEAGLVQELKELTASPMGTDSHDHADPVLFRFQDLGRWAAGIAAVLVIGVMGFYLGGQTVSAPASGPTAGTVDSVASAQVKLSNLVDQFSEMNTADPVMNLNEVGAQGAMLDMDDAVEELAYVFMGTDIDMDNEEDAMMMMAMLDEGTDWMEVIQ